MRIKTFQVKGFKRLALANIRTLSAEFTSPFQVILGRNGCGKSSILKELSPMPAESGSYGPMGFKEVVIEHNGQEFITKSVNKSTMKHEFWCDGIQLNQGGTATVQRELVKRYFGLTPSLLDLLNGTTVFQHMSVAKRRELFTELCPVDLSYALGVYNKLRTAYRDTIGARKHAEGRLAVETGRLMPESEYNTLEAQIGVLQDELNVLMANRDVRANDKRTANLPLENTLADITKLSSQVVEAGLPVFGIGLSEYQIADELVGVGKQIAATTAIRDKLLEECGELEKALAEIARTKGENKEVLLMTLKELQEDIIAIPTDARFTYPDNLRVAIEDDDIDTLVMKVCDLLTHMPDPSKEDKFDHEAIENTKHDIEYIEAGLIRLKDQQSRALLRLESLELAKPEECPNCNFRFVVGMKPNELQNLGEYLDKAKLLIEEKEKELGRLRRLAEAHVSFENSLSEMRGLCRSYPLHRGLWDYFVERGFPFCSPRSLVPAAHLWKNCLLNEFKRAQLKLRIADVNELLAKLESHATDDVNAMPERAFALHQQIESSTQLLCTLVKSESHWREVLGGMKQMSLNNENLSQKKDELGDFVKQEIAALRDTAIARCIDGHHNQLGVMVSQLSQQKVAIGIVKDLEQSVTLLKSQEVAYAKLLDELSPTDGLIAEQISGFIGCFVEKLNQILERIWTYPLRVLPCGLHDGDLDYNFPIEMAEEAYTAPDVSCGSEAQRDVIDFAFKLTVGLYLKHTDWPLYLDELGASFDEEHRSRVLAFVKDYVDMGKAAQCFYISHYASTHAAMESAEICVIDGENIHVPRQHNKHVKIT